MIDHSPTQHSVRRLLAGSPHHSADPPSRRSTTRVSGNQSSLVERFAPLFFVFSLANFIAVVSWAFIIGCLLLLVGPAAVSVSQFSGPNSSSLDRFFFTVVMGALFASVTFEMASLTFAVSAKSRVHAAMSCVTILMLFLVASLMITQIAQS